MAYATLTELAAYAAGSVTGFTAWSAVDDGSRTRALATASRHLDAVPLLTIGSPPQQAAKDACCEEALFLLAMTPDDIDRERLMTLGVVSRTAGDATESAQSAVVQARAQGPGALRSPLARSLVAPLRARRVAVT